MSEPFDDTFMQETVDRYCEARGIDLAELSNAEIAVIAEVATATEAQAREAVDELIQSATGPDVNISDEEK
jgi:hypothetical protein